MNNKKQYIAKLLIGHIQFKESSYPQSVGTVTLEVVKKENIEEQKGK